MNFEEDYLTNNLEFVYSDDKHTWFAENDFWYWDGIKNGGDAAEMRLEFPLYDVAKVSILHIFLSICRAAHRSRIRF